MLICIDAGHYRYTPGKRCLQTLDPNETREWVLNSRIANAVQNILKGYNCQTMRVDDVTGEKEVTIYTRAALANKAKATCYVSIHHNAGLHGKDGGGIVVYINPSHQEQSEVLQKNIYDGLIAQTGLKGNRATPMAEADHYVTRATTMPAVLCECGFMDSPTDVPIILTDEFANKAAQGIVDGLVATYSLKKIETSVGEKTEYSAHDGINIFKVPVSQFAVAFVDAKKTTCGKNYCNAGYFGCYSENDVPFVLPAGHMIANLESADSPAVKYLKERGTVENGKARFDSFGWSYKNPFHQKSVTTLLIRNGAASIEKVFELPAADYALAGIPVIQNGEAVKSSVARLEGWDQSSLRSTWHVFAGLKGDGYIYLIGMYTRYDDLLESKEVYEKLAPLGFKDVLKLDGGGSYIMNTDVFSAKTSEDRQICTIIRMGDVGLAQFETPSTPEDEKYTEWRQNMQRYMNECAARPASSWAVNGIEEAKNRGITDGTRPGAIVTREEAILMANAAAKF